MHTLFFIASTTLLLAWAILNSGAAHASGDGCSSEPTPRCLIASLVRTASEQREAPWLTPELNAHLMFEAQQWKIPATHLATESGQQNIHSELEQEEQFLAHLQHQRWRAAEALLPILAPQMQDFWRSPPSAVMLESLTLALQDTNADQLKKDFYASLLKQSSTLRAQPMLAVARHEILGGQPDKGRITLANTDIDAFSPSEFFQARRATEILAVRSEQLFLQPDEGLQSCSTASDIGRALHLFLSDDLFLSHHQRTPLSDAESQIQSLLMLARLYHNSAQCPLLELWLRNQAVFMATQLPADDEHTLLQRIFIARVIRRHLN